MVDIGESGHSPATFSLDAIARQLFRFGDTIQVGDTVAVGPTCGLHNYRKKSALTCKRGRRENVGQCQKSESPISGVRSGRVLFRYNETELHPRAKLHMFSIQHYLQL